jgi:hypothetical protein
MATSSIPQKYGGNKLIAKAIEMSRGSQPSFIRVLVNKTRTRNRIKNRLQLQPLVKEHIGIFDKLLSDEARKINFCTPSLGIGGI